jgi:hypothetical protein
MGLSLTVAAGPRQRSHSQVRVPRDSWPYLNVQIRDPHNLDGQVSVFISPKNRVARLYPRALCSRFVASYDSQGYGGDIRTTPHKGVCRLSTNSSGHYTSARTAYKTLLIVVVQSFQWEHVCLRSRYLATALVYLLISRSFSSNGSTCYIILCNTPVSYRGSVSLWRVCSVLPHLFLYKGYLSIASCWRLMDPCIGSRDSIKCSPCISRSFVSPFLYLLNFLFNLRIGVEFCDVQQKTSVCCAQLYRHRR